MNNQRIELRLGLMVLFATGFLVYMAVLFGKHSFFNFGGDYKIVVRFESAPGLVLGTSVFKNGVKIGQVGSVQLVDDDREVQVVLLIQNGRKIYTNEVCTIKTPTIMGETTVEFVRKKNHVGPITLLDPDGEPIIGAVPDDLFGSITEIEGEMVVAIRKVSDAAGELADFMSRISMFVGTPEEIAEKQARLDTAITEAMETMHTIGTLTKNVNDIVADPEINAHIRSTTCQMPETMEKMQGLIGDSRHFLGELRASSTKLGGVIAKIDESLTKINRTIDSVDPFTQALGTDGPKITASLRQSSEKLGGFFDELTGLVSGIGESDGTIMRLLKSDELYGNIKQVVYNAERLTGDLRPAVAELQPILRNARPVVDNAKVFTDKLARDPSAIVSGLIRRQPPVKGGLPQWGDGLGSDGMCADDLAMIRHSGGYAPVCGVNGLAGRNTPMALPQRGNSLFRWPFGKKQARYEGTAYADHYGNNVDCVDCGNGVDYGGVEDAETMEFEGDGGAHVGADGRRYVSASPEEYMETGAHAAPRLRPSQGRFETVEEGMEIEGLPFEPLGPMLGNPVDAPVPAAPPQLAPVPDLTGAKGSAAPVAPAPISARSTAAARPLMNQIPFPQPPQSNQAARNPAPVLSMETPAAPDSPGAPQSPRLVFTHDPGAVR